MRKLYPRLAATNLKKNHKVYIPYLMACTVTVMMFCILMTLAMDPVLRTISGGSEVQLILWFGCIVVGVFSAIILFYTNSVLVKQRKREFGLYNILGMEKRHIGRVLLWETVYAALIALVLGLFSAGLFSKLLQLLFLRLLGGAAGFALNISLPVIGVTAAVFAALFFVLYLNTLRVVHLSSPAELLRGTNEGEREPKSNWMLALIGVVCLASGYIMSIKTSTAYDAIGLFFVAVLLVIAGTYLLFMSCSIVFLKALRRNKRYYYKTQHFATVSGMLYRMKRNAAGLASICILSTMVLVTVSTTVCLYLGLGSTLDNMYPHDIQITQRQKNILTDAAPEALLAQAESAAAGEGRTLRHESYIIHSRVYWTLSGDTFRFGDQQDGAEYTVSLMTAAEYSRLTGRAVSLAPDEMLVYTSEGTVPETFRIESTPYRVAGTLDTFQGESRAMISNIPNAGFVVADDSVLSAIYAQSGGNFTTYLDLYLDCDGTDAEKIAFYDVLNDTLGKADDIYMDSRQLSAIDFYSMYGGFLFLGMFLGILFLAATALIIYYKQVSEGYEDRKRFEIMQQVGMSRREVRETINSQVRMVFFLPLAVAALHILMAFSMIRKLLLLFSLTDVGLFALCTVGTLLIFSAIYALVYSFTAKAYYKIVRST